MCSTNLTLLSIIYWKICCEWSEVESQHNSKAKRKSSTIINVNSFHFIIKPHSARTVTCCILRIEAPFMSSTCDLITNPTQDLLRYKSTTRTKRKIMMNALQGSAAYALYASNVLLMVKVKFNPFTFWLNTYCGRESLFESLAPIEK